MNDCVYCKMISAALLQQPHELKLYGEREDGDLGSWEEYTQQKSCPECQFIVRHLHGTNGTVGCGEFRPDCRLCIYRTSFGLWITNSCPHIHGFLEILPQKLNLDPMNEYFIPVDHSEISVTRLRTWAEYCDSNHRGHCHNLAPPDPVEIASNLIFVDVELSCLVHASGSAQYLALSYVWGRISPTLELKAETANKLFQVGSLTLLEFKELLPTTINDAMCVTKALGVRYLWVDRLCIIQDDYKNMMEQLENMASIYANAYFTIIALDGNDANYGLRGLTNTSGLPRYEQKLIEFPGPIKVLVGRKTENYGKPWHKRGWTFQERVISPRCLVFQEGTVFWSCRRAKWLEEVAAEPEGVPKDRCSQPEGFDTRTNYDLKNDPWPNVPQYWNLVETFTQRHLTFETDALRAFSAIIDVQSRTFPGGFLWGLPAFYFDMSLLWESSGPLERRPTFPSWSWLGWKGEIGQRHIQSYCEPRCDGYNPNWNCELQPTNTWYILNLQGERIQIKNSWYSYYAIRNDSSIPLPPGWSVFETETDSAGSRGADGNSSGDDNDEGVGEKDGYDQVLEDEEPGPKKRFYHIDLGDTGFRYPIPISQTPLKPTSDNWSPFLSFSTRRNLYFLGDSFNPIPGFKKPHRLFMNLQDLDGSWVGIVESNIADEACALTMKGRECEMIVMSTGVEQRRKSPNSNHFREMEVCDAIKFLQTYEYYNVLWIKRENDMAYRIAIGRVWKEAWDRKGSEKVDVILG